MMWIKKNILYVAWAQALAALFGSLYFSEIVGIPPCILCWIQRIFMYPLVVIIAVGIMRKDKSLPYYVLPLSIPGFLVAFYQHLLQVGIISEKSAPCSVGISCITKYWSLFDFITLPLLSAVAFAVITLCVVIFLKNNDKRN